MYDICVYMHLLCTERRVHKLLSLFMYEKGVHAGANYLSVSSLNV